MQGLRAGVGVRGGGEGMRQEPTCGEGRVGTGREHSPERAHHSRGWLNHHQHHHQHHQQQRGPCQGPWRSPQGGPPPAAHPPKMTGCPSWKPMLPLHRSPCSTLGRMGPAPCGPGHACMRMGGLLAVGAEDPTPHTHRRKKDPLYPISVPWTPAWAPLWEPVPVPIWHTHKGPTHLLPLTNQPQPPHRPHPPRRTPQGWAAACPPAATAWCHLEGVGGRVAGWAQTGGRGGVGCH